MHTIQINDVSGPSSLAFQALIPLQVVLVVTIGEADDRTVAPDSAESHDQTRLVVYELTDAKEYEFGETVMSKIGDFVFEGCAEGFTVCADAPSR